MEFWNILNILLRFPYTTMKRTLLLIGMVLLISVLMAQAPQAFKYQAVIKEQSGQVLSNQNVNLRISILQSAVDGPEVYGELQTVMTSELGLISIQIGNGKNPTGSLSAIDWGAGSHYLRIEMDPAGETNFELMGVSQLLSVPYALYAEKSGSGKRDADFDWEVIGYDVVTGHGGSYPLGNVGIGNNAPGSLLYVAKNMGEPTITIRNLGGGGGATYAMVDDLSGANWKFKATTYGGFKIRDHAWGLDVLTMEPIGTANALYIKTGGFVGIGKNTPNERLDVAGRVHSDQGFNVNGTNGWNDTTNQVTAFDFTSNKLKYRTYIHSGGILMYASVESAWVDSVGDYLLSVQPFTCGDTLIDTRDQQAYATILIGTQCWMAQNLNVGTKINSTHPGIQQFNNEVIEKYCFSNTDANCDTYGGLYEWGEAMQYVTTEGAQGLCPDGWHIPTDNEWKILEGVVDSQYPVGDAEWDATGFRGLDAGGKLKEAGTTHWNSPNEGATNSSGFTGLPWGYRASFTGNFDNLGIEGYFWSSTPWSNFGAYMRRLYNAQARVDRYFWYSDNGFSIRCLKN